MMRLAQIIGIWAMGAGVAMANTDACSIDRVSLRGDHDQITFNVELADDLQSRALGLMHRPSMPTDSGMIFFYDSPIHARFWMRNTLIPLDMIFVGDDGRVKHIHENAIPLDLTVIDGGRDILVVLEINGGLSKEIGLSAGTELLHPMFDQKIVSWSCEKVVD